jgi:hypothetical protein
MRSLLTTALWRKVKDQVVRNIAMWYSMYQCSHLVERSSRMLLLKTKTPGIAKYISENTNTILEYKDMSTFGSIVCA